MMWNRPHQQRMQQLEKFKHSQGYRSNAGRSHQEQAAAGLVSSGSSQTCPTSSPSAAGALSAL